jgi:NADH dehydrogenase (ubiquinone) 1 alpha subcomplex subunit 12/NADH dehydrogenase [ubiquinone] 1 alpha subcomplex assembly factor 2
MLFDHIRGVLRVGLEDYLKQVWFLREFRGGQFVGRDSYGNVYYEVTDPNIPFYRKRYVELAEGDDSSQVPADWHGWLHYTNDDAPSRSSRYVYPPWASRHTKNLTGTSGRYIPYSTTVRKIIPFSLDNLDNRRVFTLNNPALYRERQDGVISKFPK